MTDAPSFRERATLQLANSQFRTTWYCLEVCGTNAQSTQQVHIPRCAASHGNHVWHCLEACGIKARSRGLQVNSGNLLRNKNREVVSNEALQGYVMLHPHHPPLFKPKYNHRRWRPGCHPRWPRRVPRWMRFWTRAHPKVCCRALQCSDMPCALYSEPTGTPRSRR